MGGGVDAGSALAVLAGHVDRVIRTSDLAVFVDPDGLGDVDDVVELGERERGVDQAGVRRVRGLDERPGVLGVLVERNGDDDEPVLTEFVLQCLPPGQVMATASPRGVGDEDDLLAAVL